MSHGYVYDVTNVNLTRNKTEYFTFKMQTQEDNHNCVCYSPENINCSKIYLKYGIKYRHWN